LGMAGREEIFEFKSTRKIDPALFLERANAAAPSGLRFGRILAFPPDVPSLLGRITEMIYRLDLEDPDVRQAATEMMKALPGPWSPDVGEAALRMIVRHAASRAEYTWLKEAGLTQGGRALELRVTCHPQKIPRPQDLLREALGLARPVYSLTRERFVLEPSLHFPN